MNQVAPFLECCKDHAEASSGSPVTIETKLMGTLRWLAGASYLDICCLFGISDSTFFVSNGILWPTMLAIDSVLKIEIGDLRESEKGFAEWSKGHLRGCVMAIDGWVPRTRQPYRSETQNISAYRNRKGFWSITVLAGCDANCKVTMLSVKCAGATNDQMAWTCCGMSNILSCIAGLIEMTTAMLGFRKMLQHGVLPEEYFIVGDEGFAAEEQLLTPWSVADTASPAHDAFNFYLSRMRQCIERTFGLITQRWGIFWRPLRCDLAKWPLVIQVAFKLHNLCLEGKDIARSRLDADIAAGDQLRVHLNSDIEGNTWSGRRRANEVCWKRFEITQYLHENGIERPRR